MGVDVREVWACCLIYDASDLSELNLPFWRESLANWYTKSVQIAHSYRRRSEALKICNYRALANGKSYEIRNKSESFYNSERSCLYLWKCGSRNRYIWLQEAAGNSNWETDSFLGLRGQVLSVLYYCFLNVIYKNN